MLHFRRRRVRARRRRPAAFPQPLRAADLAAAPGSGPGASEAQRVCSNFPTIREDVEKGAAVIKAASERKASREEVCPLFKTFAGKEGQDGRVP